MLLVNSNSIVQLYAYGTNSYTICVRLYHTRMVHNSTNQITAIMQHCHSHVYLVYFCWLRCYSGWNNHVYKHKEALKTSIDHLRNKQNITQLTFQCTRLNV